WWQRRGSRPSRPVRRDLVHRGAVRPGIGQVAVLVGPEAASMVCRRVLTRSIWHKFGMPEAFVSEEFAHVRPVLLLAMRFVVRVPEPSINDRHHGVRRMKYRCLSVGLN